MVDGLCPSLIAGGGHTRKEAAMSKWKSPLLAVAAALLAGSVAMTDGADQRNVAGAGMAAAFILIGVWVATGAGDTE